MVPNSLRQQVDLRVLVLPISPDRDTAPHNHQRMDLSIHPFVALINATYQQWLSVFNAEIIYEEDTVPSHATAS